MIRLPLSYRAEQKRNNSSAPALLKGAYPNSSSMTSALTLFTLLLPSHINQDQSQLSGNIFWNVRQIWFPKQAKSQSLYTRNCGF
jgi:hypothetical protein